MKTIIKIFICLSLIYTPFFAFAGAAEKWEVLENNYDHLSNKVKIEARKISQSAANSGRYKVEIPVNANTLGATAKRMLWAGAAVGAITALVEGVGWVIDEGSQVIKKPIQPGLTPEPITKFYFKHGTYFPNTSNKDYGDFTSCKGYYQSLSAMQSCLQSKAASGFTIEKRPDYDSYVSDAIARLLNKTTSQTTTVSSSLFRLKQGSWTAGEFDVLYGINVNLPDSPPSGDYVIISDSQLGNEILGNGTEPNSRTEPASDIITDAYSPNNPVQDAPAPQEAIRALENANPEPEVEPTGETKPKPNSDTDGDGEPDAYDPAQPDKGTEFKLPNFCSWAPAVCDFFKVQKADNKDIKNNQREQIEQDKTFFEKVAEWFDWSQADEELPDNESPEIVEHITPDLKEDAISWGSACPADFSIPISMQGVSSTLVFSWSPWCQLLSIIKPAIVASAYMGAAFIVLGLRT